MYLILAIVLYPVYFQEIPAELCQKIASELNQTDTAFVLSIEATDGNQFFT